MKHSETVARLRAAGFSVARLEQWTVAIGGPIGTQVEGGAVIVAKESIAFPKLSAAPGPADAKRFIANWLAGLTRAPLLPCRSEALWRAYRAEGGILAGAHQLARAARELGAVVRALRYLDGRQVRQRRFIVPPGNWPEILDRQWMANCVREFDAATVKRGRGRKRM